MRYLTDQSSGFQEAIRLVFLIKAWTPVYRCSSLRMLLNCHLTDYEDSISSSSTLFLVADDSDSSCAAAPSAGPVPVLAFQHGGFRSIAAQDFQDYIALAGAKEATIYSSTGRSAANLSTGDLCFFHIPCKIAH